MLHWYITSTIIFWLIMTAEALVFKDLIIKNGWTKLVEDDSKKIPRIAICAIPIFRLLAAIVIVYIACVKAPEQKEEEL